jgi:hypothetical protein
MYKKMEYNNLSFARCICTYRTEDVQKMIRWRMKTVKLGLQKKGGLQDPAANLPLLIGESPWQQPSLLPDSQ